MKVSSCSMHCFQEVLKPHSTFLSACLLLSVEFLRKHESWYWYYSYLRLNSMSYLSRELDFQHTPTLLRCELSCWSGPLSRRRCCSFLRLFHEIPIVRSIALVLLWWACAEYLIAQRQEHRSCQRLCHEATSAEGRQALGYRCLAASARL